MTDDEVQQIRSGPQKAQFAALVRAMELGDFFAQRNYSDAEVERCLADEKGLEALVRSHDSGVSEYGVSGTPTFILNGEPLEGVTSWQALEPLLRSRMEL